MNIDFRKFSICLLFRFHFCQDPVLQNGYTPYNFKQPHSLCIICIFRFFEHETAVVDAFNFYDDPTAWWLLGKHPVLKNDGVRQLGWWQQPNIHGKMPNWWLFQTTKTRKKCRWLADRISRNTVTPLSMKISPLSTCAPGSWVVPVPRSLPADRWRQWVDKPGGQR